MTRNTYYYRICDEIPDDVNQNIVDYIDLVGDIQYHKTNVKAQMTEWDVFHDENFVKIGENALKFSRDISKQIWSVQINPLLTNIWGMKYKSNEYAIPHDHFPSLFSFAYYINPPENSTLSFPELNRELKNENKMLVIFPGHMLHEVKPKEFTGHRYVVSGNIENKNKDKKSIEVKDGI